MKDTVMVTGGSGFLGGHLVNSLLNDGYEVVVFDLSLPRPGSEIDWLWGEKKAQLKFVRGNISDITAIYETVKKYNVNRIVHAAVINDLEILEKRPLYTMKVNVEGTLNVLEAARLFELSKVVFTSSISVYAPRQYVPMDERHPVHLPDEGPTLLSYSSSKLSAEAFALHYWSTYGLDIVSLRFSAIYGLGMQYPMYVKPMVEDAVSGRETYFPGGKEACRDYTYIKDVVQGIKLALTTETKHRIFNIATGQPLQTPVDAARLMQEIVPSSKISIGDETNPVEARTATTRGILSIDLAVKELGYQPRYTLKEGLCEYFEDYRNYQAAK